MQLTWDDIQDRKTIEKLTGTQRRILSLLACGYNQSLTAQRLKLSRAYVNQQVKRFESLGLVQRTAPKPEGSTRTLFYELSPQAQKQIQDKSAPFTVCRVHHCGTRYRILRQDKPVSTDKRTAHDKSWTMRGGQRHAYHYSGKKGYPSCTVYVHPKTILAWVDKGQTIPAATIKDAERIATLAIHEAVQRFTDGQARFGVRIELDHGTNYKRHYGFAIREDHPDIEKPLENKDWWIDKSISEVESGYKELETDVRENASALAQTINIAPHFPDLIRQTIDPLQQGVNRVEAMMQGGRPLEVQYARALDLIERLLERLEAQDKRITELENANSKI